jgi:hypothetical protein
MLLSKVAKLLESPCANWPNEDAGLQSYLPEDASEGAILPGYPLPDRLKSKRKTGEMCAGLQKRLKNVIDLSDWLSFTALAH